MKRKLWLKNGVSVAVIAAGGYVLFLLMFILAALTAQAGDALTRAISGKEDIGIGQPTWAFVFAVLLAFASWLIFRSKFNDLIKATYLTAPLMVAFVLTGILLYGRPQWLILGAGTAITIAVLAYLSIRKLSWLYFAATIYAAGIAAYVALAGIEI